MADEKARPADSDLAEELYDLVRELYPICRSITGEGVRETLRILGRFVPIQVTEVPSGTRVLDWEVPREWNIREAWIRDPEGRRVVDFASHSLRVVSYSVPVRRCLSLAELRPHLHTLPDRPDWIPYRTSYYAEDWGFCLTQRELDALPEGRYEVCIESTLAPGSLTYGEVVLPGTSEEEILISSHLCHPSLCDDNLSSIAVSVLLARHLLQGPRRRHTIRFLYAPGTIGAITWLARNRERVGSIRHGLVLSCLGDRHPFTYKRTLGGAAEIDRACAHVLGRRGDGSGCIDFFPYGYDERQYNSPGFRAPVGSLMRGRHGMFPEYHTSADDLSLVTGEALLESFGVLQSIIDLLETNRRYLSLCPEGEPQLGRRGLYRAMGGENVPDLQLAMLWVLCLSDGEHDLLSVAERSGLPYASVREAARLLLHHGLIKESDL